MNSEVVKLRHCPSKDHIAHVFTKPLRLEQFEKRRGMLEVIDAAELS